MEGRKLQLTGGSTYVVSLPKRWVTDAGLKAGDTVFLEPQVDGAVQIRARSMEKPLARRRVFEEKGAERRDDALARDVAQRDQDVDRLYWMVAKQYNLAHTPGAASRDAGEKTELHNYRLIAKLFERIGDHAERIARTYPVFAEHGLEPRLLKELDAARDSAIAILDKAFFALLTADIDSANEAVDDLDRHQKLIDGLSHHVASKKGEELLALAAIVDSLARSASYATDIAEIAIDYAVSKGAETP